MNKPDRPLTDTNSFIEGLVDGLQLKQKPIAYLTGKRQLLGGSWFTRIGPNKGFVTGDPDIMAEALGAKGQVDIIKSPLYDQLGQLIGRSLLSLEGEQWKRLRKKSQPAFSQGATPSIARPIYDEIERWVADGELEGVTAMQPMFGEMALRVVVSALLGVPTGDFAKTQTTSVVTGEPVRLPVALAEATQVGNEMVGKRIRSPIKVPFNQFTRKLGFHRSFHRTMDFLNGAINEWVIERLQEAEENSLLKMLASKDKGGAIEGKELADLITTLFFAGQETTANTLSWGLVELVKNQALQEGLYIEAKEQAAAVKDDPMSILGNSPLMAKFILECLRLYPAVMVMGRTPTDEHITTDSKGQRFKVAGSSVMLLSPYLLHTDPDRWNDAAWFDVTRWSEEQAANPLKTVLHTENFMPFSSGGHTCIGYRMAMLEMMLAWHQLLLKHRFTGPDHNPASEVKANNTRSTIESSGVESKIDVQPAPALTMKPSCAVRVTISKRVTISV